MINNEKKRGPHRQSPLPLILAGAGLILLSIAAVVFIPNENTPAKTGDGNSPVPGVVNQPSPDLELSDLKNNPVSLSGLRGQVVLVNNWATWCPPCRAEMPELESYFQAHKDEGFTLVGINAGDPQDQVVEFVREYGLSFPVWLDPTSKALRVFNNHALPSSYVIDREGMIRFAWMGAVSLGTLETHVTPLLAE